MLDLIISKTSIAAEEETAARLRLSNVYSCCMISSLLAIKK